MPTQMMALRQIWMIKIICQRMMHPEPLHHTPGADVRGDCERHDIAEPEPTEPKSQYLPPSFRRVAVSPVRPGQSPTDFNTWREIDLEGRNGETYITNEGRDPRKLNRPQAEAVRHEVSLNPIGEIVALLRGQNAREMLHHHSVSVKTAERSPVIGPPGTQPQAGSLYFKR